MLVIKNERSVIESTYASLLDILLVLGKITGNTAQPIGIFNSLASESLDFLDFSMFQIPKKSRMVVNPILKKSDHMPISKLGGKKIFSRLTLTRSNLDNIMSTILIKQKQTKNVTVVLLTMRLQF